MSATNINIRTDSEHKSKAQSVFAGLVLDMSTAINIYFHQVVYRRAIPFELTMSKNKRQVELGGWEGMIWMSDDFNEPMEELP